MGIIQKIVSTTKGSAKVKARGKLLVIDGIDGSGKTTQFNLLIDSLRTAGYRVETEDFPRYGQDSATLIEKYLNGDYGQLTAEAASILFALDRFDASFKIRQWLDEGTIVVLNRYVTANAGHHGGKISDRIERVKFFKWLDHLEYNIFNIPKPDLNLILHVPAEVAQKLVDLKHPDTRKYAKGANKIRDLHEADLEHLKNAEQSFLEIAKLFPNTKLVECIQDNELMSPKQIHNRIWELVRRIALKDFPPHN